MIKYIQFVDSWDDDRNQSFVNGRYSRETLLKKFNEWRKKNIGIRILGVETKSYPISGYTGANDGEMVVWYEGFVEEFEEYNKQLDSENYCGTRKTYKEFCLEIIK